MSVKDDVLKYFLEKEKITGNNEKENLRCNYIERQLLSSIDIVEMVVYFEEQYNIFFSDKDMESDEFQTIGGLIALIERLKKNKFGN